MGNASPFQFAGWESRRRQSAVHLCGWTPSSLCSLVSVIKLASLWFPHIVRSVKVATGQHNSPLGYSVQQQKKAAELAIKQRQTTYLLLCGKRHKSLISQPEPSAVLILTYVRVWVSLQHLHLWSITHERLTWLGSNSSKKWVSVFVFAGLKLSIIIIVIILKASYKWDCFSF